MLKIAFEDHGTVVLLRPLDEEARAWMEEFLVAEPWQWFGGALACDPRLAQGLLNELENER